MDLNILQHYWWILICILGGLLVFLLFVQGGQSLLYTIGKNKDERDLIVNTLGHKWEYTFTTLVVFGGAFFASFPLFYSTSFGGAYVVWMLILFCFVLQAVSYEYRNKKNNFLGSRTYEVFLMINGFAAPLLLGAAVATFFTGSPFRLGVMHDVEWMTPWRGLDALFVITNYFLALAVFFLARTLAALYFILTIDDPNIRIRSHRQVKFNAVPFVLFFLLFIGFIFAGEGYAITPEGNIALVPYRNAAECLDIHYRSSRSTLRHHPKLDISPMDERNLVCRSRNGIDRYRSADSGRFQPNRLLSLICRS